jgi:hypothetical protein
MKAHKRREPSHEYCHKCNVDCEDDLDLLIHMIESGRHSKAIIPLFTYMTFNLTLNSRLSNVFGRVQEYFWA